MRRPSKGVVVDKPKGPVPYYTRRPEGAGREILKAETKNEPGSKESEVNKTPTR